MLQAWTTMDHGQDNLVVATTHPQHKNLERLGKHLFTAHRANSPKGNSTIQVTSNVVKCDMFRKKNSCVNGVSARSKKYRCVTFVARQRKMENRSASSSFWNVAAIRVISLTEPVLMIQLIT